MYIASLRVWFKFRTDDCAMYSNWRTYSLWVCTGGHVAAAEATKNICWVKGEGTVDHSTVTRWLKTLWSDYKVSMIRQDQVGQKKKTPIDSEARLQAIEANVAIITQWVFGKLNILQSSVVCHIHRLSKSIWNSRTVPHITKIVQNLWLIQIYIYVYIYER